MTTPHDAVSFDELVAHWFGSPSEREAFPEMYATFQSQHGTIIDEYWCATLRGAAAVTDRLQIYCCYERVDAPEYDALARRLGRCTSSATRAYRMLKGQDLRSSQEIFFDSAKDCLDLLDEVARRQQKGTAPLSDAVMAQALARVDDGLQQGLKIYEQAAQRTAQSWYLVGVLLATAAIAIMSGLIVVASSLGLDAGAAPGIILAGAAGALLSVLSRMSNGGLILDHEAGIPMLRLLGAVRPVVGVTAGAALCVLAASGLLPLKVPSNPGDQALFFVGISFLAGFSERWAQDMLATGQSRTTSGRGPASGPT